jgi:hypothetical protein
VPSHHRPLVDKSIGPRRRWATPPPIKYRRRGTGLYRRADRPAHLETINWKRGNLSSHSSHRLLVATLNTSLVFFWGG